MIACSAAPRTRCRLSVRCAIGALEKTSLRILDNAPKAQSTDNRQRVGGSRQAAGDAA
jgi:hypothetical protein